jgi:hypothetical protein
MRLGSGRLYDAFELVPEGPEGGIVSSWHSYPKIYNVGHAAVQDLFAQIVYVEEKIDGSQFSFGVFDGVLKVRSKGVEMDAAAPEKMFSKAVATAKQLQPLLRDGWTYRAEYLSVPKHNTLAYDRVPEKHLIIFDINSGEEQYLTYEEKRREAERLGLEAVPLLQIGKISAASELNALMNRVSVLGGQKIEGLVIKQYTLFGADKKMLFAKHVSEAFKELHAGDWKERNPNGGDIIERLVSELKTPARWEKAVQHLRERGALENTPRDIGYLLAEIKTDTLAECRKHIEDRLFDWAWAKVQRGIIAGVPEWYKQRLLQQQFETVADGQVKP